MAEPSAPDLYEVLQLSPRADQETIQRVFRHLAKRLHPDAQGGGDAERFSVLLEAFRVLSDPEQRARYDATYEREREARWRVFDPANATDCAAADRHMRDAILAVLYTARRNSPARPGLGAVDLERLLGCPEAHLEFHLWYLKENGWIQRLESGLIAITATGVDRALETGATRPNGHQPLHLTARVV